MLTARQRDDVFSCTAARQLIYSDGKRPLAFKLHVLRCSDCRYEYRASQQDMRDLRAMAPPPAIMILLKLWLSRGRDDGTGGSGGGGIFAGRMPRLMASGAFAGGVAVFALSIFGSNGAFDGVTQLQGDRSVPSAVVTDSEKSSSGRDHDSADVVQVVGQSGPQGVTVVGGDGRPDSNSGGGSSPDSTTDTGRNHGQSGDDQASTPTPAATAPTSSDTSDTSQQNSGASESNTNASEQQTQTGDGTTVSTDSTEAAGTTETTTPSDTSSSGGDDSTNSSDDDVASTIAGGGAPSSWQFLVAGIGSRPVIQR